MHAGFGVFNDIIPAQIADLAATNAPYAPTFVGGIGGQVGGVAIAPDVPDSAADAASNANRQIPVGLQRGCRALRGTGRGRAGLPAGRQPEHLSHRHAQDAVLLPVQPRRSSGSWARMARCASTMWARAACTSRSRWA